MRKWYLLWVYMILLLFQWGLLRNRSRKYVFLSKKLIHKILRQIRLYRQGYRVACDGSGHGNPGPATYQFKKTHNLNGKTDAGNNYTAKIKAFYNSNLLVPVEKIGGYEGTNPVIPCGGTDEWDEKIRNEIGNILYEPTDTGKEYKTWFPAFIGAYNGQPTSVGYAYSSDGITWTKVQCSGLPITGKGAEDMYILNVSGTYYMYYELKTLATHDGIALATSADGETWADQGLILEKQGVGWEGQDVTSPVVWIEDSTWYMLYEGRPPAGDNGKVGLATSADGITWVREATNPVFTDADTTWASEVVCDELVKIGSTYYQTYHGNGVGWQGGLATSTDLLSWTDSVNSPLFHRTTTATTMFFNNGEYVFHYCPQIPAGADSAGIYRGYPDHRETVDLEGNCRTDFEDVTFSDAAESELYYFLAEKVDSDYAIYFAKVEDNLDSDQSINIHYGNTAAVSKSDGPNTFVFFDHFLGTSIDADKWTTSGTISVFGSMCHIAGTGTIKAEVSGGGAVEDWEQPYAMGVKCKSRVGNPAADWYLGFEEDNDNFAEIRWDDSENKFQAWSRDAASNTTTELTAYSSRVLHNIYEIIWHSSYNRYSIDWKERAEHTTNINTGDSYLIFAASDQYILLDWAFVRKYVDGEDSIHGAWGTEQEVDVSRDFKITSSANFEAGTHNDTATDTDNPSALSGTLEIISPETITDSDTKGLFHFNETLWDGTADEVVDDSGEGNHGKAFNNTIPVTGQWGNGAYFDGVNQYIQLATALNSIVTVGSDYSVSLWFRSLSIGNQHLILIASGGTDRNYIYLRNSKIVGGTYDGAFDNRGGAFTDTASWHHIVLINDSGTVKVYLDNVEQTTDEDGEGGATLVVGAWLSHSTTNPFHGLIDEVKIFDKALSTSEISALYNSGNKYKTSGEWKSASQTISSIKKIQLVIISFTGVSATYTITPKILDASDDSELWAGSAITSGTSQSYTESDFGVIDINFKVELDFAGDGGNRGIITQVEGDYIFKPVGGGVNTKFILPLDLS